MNEIVKKYRNVMDCPNCGEKRIQYQEDIKEFFCRKCEQNFAVSDHRFLLQAKWHQGFDKGYWVALQSVISSIDNMKKVYGHVLRIMKMEEEDEKEPTIRISTVEKNQKPYFGTSNFPPKEPADKEEFENENNT